MFLLTHRFDRVLRIVVLIAILAAMTAVPRAAVAQPAPVQRVSGSPMRLAQPDQPPWTTQEVLDQLGIPRPQAADKTEYSQQVAKWVQANGVPTAARVPQQPEVGGLPNNLSGKAALSAAILTTLNSGSGSNYRDVMLMADVDGSENLVADHAAKIDDLSTSSLPGDWMLTRAAISEHTIANGFTETVYYYGDSVGNVYVGVDDGTSYYGSQVVTYTVLNLPTMLNAFGSLNSDDQIVITGIGVSPVTDLSSFPRVNGSYASFDGQIGEILYVTFWDTGSGLRLNYPSYQVVQSGLLAIPISDVPSPAKTPPGVQSDIPFPITVGGAFGVFFSPYANVAGVAVDDNGSVYIQQVDLNGFTGGNIVKVTSVDQPGLGGNQDRSAATNGFVAQVTTLDPVNGSYGYSSGPANQLNRFTNYSGTSATFGNIVSLAAGPGNILYAAVARSFVPGDSSDVKRTEGLFTNPAALGATPSMIISFADTSGAFDQCSAPHPTLSGSIPIADDFADVVQKNLALVAGVNNFRALVLGVGPDVRGHLIGATLANTLKMEFQVDDTIYSGLAVDEESKVYAISGGTPGGVGLNPSPSLGEILVFPDQRPFDRRADYIDLRAAVPFTPPNLVPNLGDGQSDRYDHLFYQAPMDQISLTPTGLSGLARGFLFYLNRTHTNMLASNLPNSRPLGNNEQRGPIPFESFDSSHQVAGGDDQTSPFHGDDSDHGGHGPITTTALWGGFEFVYREYVTTTHSLKTTAWNAFNWNSNGSISFGSGDTSNVPNAGNFLSGTLKVAAAWTDLNPGSRVAGHFTNTFPVQALGFASINHFIVNSTNVPEFGKEGCNSSNTFSISIYDDGTSVDENSNQPLNPANPIGNNAVAFDLREGPTDLHFSKLAGGTLAADFPRLDKSGNICIDYGRMDLLGSAAANDSTLVGITPGKLTISSLPQVNLSLAARTHDAPFPSAQGLGVGPFPPAAPYQFFTTGVPATYTVNLIVSTTLTTTIPAKPVFDLRQEGNDPALSTPVNQTDLNRGQVCFYNLTSAVFLPVALKN